MERSKIKSVIIVILLAMDLALGFMLLNENLSAKRINDQAMEDLIQVLESSHIELKCDLTGKSIYALEAVRNNDSERKVAEALVGDCEMENQGGNIHLYRGSRGDAYFRGSGEFEVVFLEGVAVGEVITELKKQGVDIEKPLTESCVCTAYQQINGRILRNSQIQLTVKDGEAESLEGRWLISPAQQNSSSAGADAFTAVMYFAGENTDSGYGCTVIKSVEQGYYMTAQVSGEFDLEPVWDIETDVGFFRVNGSDLHVEQVRN